MGIKVQVRVSSGSKITVEVELVMTVAETKELIARELSIPSSEQRLIYKGRVLKDEKTLESYGLEADHTIHLVRHSAPGSITSSATSVTPTPAESTTAATPTPTAPLGLGGLGLGGLGGTGGLGDIGGLGAFGDPAALQQQLLQNPALMREMMNSPMMQGVMDNPELLRGILMSNPQVRDIMERNPQLNHALSDPALLRQTLQAATNPELMREMMRTTDRAMHNMESAMVPGGFNALRRMYEDVQEPLLDSMTRGNAGGAADLAGTAPSGQPTVPAVHGGGAMVAGGGAAAGAGGGGAGGTTAPGPAPNAAPLPNPWGPQGAARPAATAAAPAAAGGQQNILQAAPGTVPSAAAPAPAGGVPAWGAGMDLFGMGLGGAGGPQGLGGTGMGPEQVMQLMQNPLVQNWMQTMMADPQMMNQVIESNPQLRAMADSNPHVRTMLANPEMVRQITSPEAMQQLLQLNTLMRNAQGGTPTPGTLPGGGIMPGGVAPLPTGAPDLSSLMAMMGGLGAVAPPPSNVPPEQLYATQLSQLQEMGFFDREENIRALAATGGNINRAVERLLGGGV